MPRSKKYPARWRVRDGRFTYRPAPDQRANWDGKSEFVLGHSESEAWRTWFERTGDAGHDDVVLMDDLFQAFMSEYASVHLSPATIEAYTHHLKPLSRAFGHMRPSAVTLQQAYRYRSERAKVAKYAANREVSCLTSALTFGVEKGWVERNELRGQISKRGAAAEPPRTRTPSYDELAHFCRVNPGLAGYVTLKCITGLRKSQMLAINLTQHWSDGVLHPPRLKGSVDTQYEGLEDVIGKIVGRRLPRGPLFLNRNGEAITVTGFNSAWRRAQKRFIADGGDHFREHDMRRTAASNAESLEQAKLLLAHNDIRTTRSIYRVGKPERVSVRERLKGQD